MQTMQTEMNLQERRWCAEDDASDQHAQHPKQGLLIVFSGPGKGKSTAAFGMAWRAIAHGQRIGVVQFVGGSQNSTDYRTLGQQPLCDFKIFGAGCLWHSDCARQDKAEVVAAWLEVHRMMDDPTYGLIICDEINPVIHAKYLNLDTIKRELTQRRPDLHMVLTGRNAPFELLDIADLATDMREVRHPLSKKIPPQAGIEF